MRDRPALSWSELERTILDIGSLPRPWWWPRWIDLAGVIAAIGAGVIVYQWAGARPMWLDEEMIALNLRERGLGSLAGPLWLGQSAPLGWLVLQRMVILAFGTGERALRLVPVLFGIGTLATAVWVGRRWMGPVGAAALALLCSFGQWLSFYVLELKHYSADTFWALLITALAAWAAEVAIDDPKDQTRRALVWWTAAAIGQWFANGALLVTPSCALVLLGVLARRGGWPVLRRVAPLGWVWLASFGLHYALSLRHSVGSDYLNSYWAFALPPPSAGLRGTLQWLASQMEPFALKPAGSNLWVLFWLAVSSGFVLLILARPPLGLAVTAVPLSACVFAAFRLVPLYERLSLWFVPALYIGVAFSADSAMRLGRRAYVRRHWVGLSLAVALGYLAYVVCADIYYRGRDDLRDNRPRLSKYQLDDRAAIRWLMAQRRPGDALLTTHLSLPALWWYGRVSVSSPDLPGGRFQDGSPIFQVSYTTGGPGCGQVTGLREALKGRARALVYLGFRFDDVPQGFDDLLLASLAELGTVTRTSRFDNVGRAAVIDLRMLPSVPAVTVRWPGFTQPTDGAAGLDGCLAVAPAARW